MTRVIERHILDIQISQYQSHRSSLTLSYNSHINALNMGNTSLFSVLLSGPTEITCKLLSRLDMRTLCRLDSACCSVATRTELRALLSSAHMILDRIPRECLRESTTFYDFISSDKTYTQRTDRATDGHYPNEEKESSDFLTSSGRITRRLGRSTLRWAIAADVFTCVHSSGSPIVSKHVQPRASAAMPSSV